MNIRQVLIISASVILAGSIFLWARTSANRPTPVANITAPKPNIEISKVLVAKRDFVVGDRITPDSIGWQDWPKTGMSPAFITQIGFPKAIEDYANAVVTQSLVVGEPIIMSKIVQAGANNGVMAALLTPGMRATTVSITADTGVAGFILPNNRVDVLLTRAIPITINGQTTNRTVSSIVFENVRVLAIDQNVAMAKEQKTITGATATLELTSTDSEKLETADNLGDISLVLRGYSDASGPTVSRSNPEAMAQPTAQNSNRNTQTQPMPQVQAQADPARSVKIYRGGQ